MKPKTFTAGRLLFALMILGVTLALVSWDFKQSSGHYRQSANDTIPKTKKTDGEKKILDLDDVLDELNAAEMKVDMEKAQREIAEAMKEFDGDKIQQEVQASMQKIDWDKMKAEFDKAKQIDMSKMEAEMKKVQ